MVWLEENLASKTAEPTHCCFYSSNWVRIFELFFDPEPEDSFNRCLTFPISFCYEVLQYLNMDPTRRTLVMCEHWLVPKGKIHDPYLWERSSGKDSLLTTPKTDFQTPMCKSSADQPYSGLLKKVWLTHTYLYNDSTHIKSFQITAYSEIPNEN